MARLHILFWSAKCPTCIKLRKSSTTATLIIDLYGHSRDEMLDVLDKSLPVWVNNAMKGGYPFVIPWT